MSVLTLNELLASFPDNSSGAITAQNMRDFVDSTRTIKADAGDGLVMSWQDSSGTQQAYMNSSGYLYAAALYSTDRVTGHYLSSTGDIYAQGHIYANTYLYTKALYVGAFECNNYGPTQVHNTYLSSTVTPVAFGTFTAGTNTVTVCYGLITSIA